MTPRLLFVNQSAVLGGGELHLRDLACEFRAGSRVLLLSDGPLRGLLEGDGVDVEVLDAGRALLAVRREHHLPSARAVAGLMWTVARTARLARHYDALYATSQKAFLVAALASRGARRPLVWHLQDILCAEHFSTGNIRVAVGLANRFAARVVANSQATADAFVGSGGRADKVRVVYNGFAAPPATENGGEEAAAVRAELGLGEEPLVGVFARFHPWKGQHVVIEAVAGLPGVHAVFVGDALFGETAYLQATRERARALGISDRTHFLGFRHDVPRLMRAVDVVVHPSVAAEPFGRVVVEGMLARRPVVASRAGGVLEILQDGVTGVLVPPGDAEALRRALGTLLVDRARRDALGRAGCARAQSVFTLPATFEGIRAVLGEVLGA